MQSHKLKFLTSVYKQRFVRKCGYFKRCKKQTDLKHDTKHARAYTSHVFVVIWANTTIINKNYAKNWLNTEFTTTLMVCCVLDVIYIEHLRVLVFYLLF